MLPLPCSESSCRMVAIGDCSAWISVGTNISICIGTKKVFCHQSELCDIKNEVALVVGDWFGLHVAEFWGLCKFVQVSSRTFCPAGHYSYLWQWIFVRVNAENCPMLSGIRIELALHGLGGNHRVASQVAECWNWFA